LWRREKKSFITLSPGRNKKLVKQPSAVDAIKFSTDVFFTLPQIYRLDKILEKLIIQHSPVKIGWNVYERKIIQ